MSERQGFLADKVNLYYFFFFSSRRRHTRCSGVSWARRCVQETGSDFGLRAKYRCETIVVSKDQRKTLWSSFLKSDGKESVKNVEARMSGFNDENHVDELQELSLIHI
eukprot:TRINITY_DN2225_c0_g1_i22.p3 TRINITY_DN2225_c0_g1~~TRINITY_DN2225_c0_g1_i22.p3  ORF type:complete len:108 (+),score=47.39 TRINITY_DN2225_c0_g1_i22:22-345(+)